MHKLSLSVKIATALFLVSHSLVIAFERSSDTATICENFTAMVMCLIVDKENNSMDLCNVIQSCSDKLQWLPHAIPVQLHVEEQREGKNSKERHSPILPGCSTQSNSFSHSCSLFTTRTTRKCRKGKIHTVRHCCAHSCRNVFTNL